MLGELQKRMTKELVNNVAYAVLRKGESPITTVKKILLEAKKEFPSPDTIDIPDEDGLSIYCGKVEEWFVKWFGNNGDKE